MERGICPIAVLYFSVERSCFHIPEILRHRSVTNRLEVGSCLVGFFEEMEKCDAGNYRPVSLTSVPCKIMETIIKTELVKYLENSGVMSNSQHGFTKGRSCLANLLETFYSRRRIWSRCRFPRF